MRQPRYTKEEVAARGQEIYERQLRDTLEPAHCGKFLVIDIEKGDYEIDEDDVAVMKRAAAKYPADSLYGMQIGSPVMGRLGAQHAEANVKSRTLKPEAVYPVWSPYDAHEAAAILGAFLEKEKTTRK